VAKSPRTTKATAMMPKNIAKGTLPLKPVEMARATKTIPINTVAIEKSFNIVIPSFLGMNYVSI